MELTLSDRSTILISEDAEMIFHTSLLKEKRHTTIGLLFGSILVKLKKLTSGNQEFSVNTVTTNAAVREYGAVLISVESG